MKRFAPITRTPVLLLVLAACLASCKHPLAIQGEGNILELRSGARGCTFAEHQAGHPRCTDNAVQDADYAVSYEPVPHEGWVFVRWEGTACGTQSLLPICEYDVSNVWVTAFDEAIEDLAFPATVAVFEPVGSVALSTNIALPMQAITVTSNALDAGELAEVVFTPINGEEPTTTFVPVPGEFATQAAIGNLNGP